MNDTSVNELSVSRLHPGDSSIPAYLALRAEMWDIPADENRQEVEQILSDPDHWAVFMECERGGGCVGFLEIRLREYAEGAVTSPVAYMEGWYVSPEFRGKGSGRRLFEAGEEWARTRGCTEMASDAEIDNARSIRAHCQLGFEEVDRIVCFLKKL